MNELLTLSDDLTVIETEIKIHKEQVGQSIFEIGRRLNHVKTHDLTHGNFKTWLEKIGLHPRNAQRMMKISQELSSNATTWSHLGERAMYLIATLPEEEREVDQLTIEGLIKKPADMTVKELQALNKELKETVEAQVQENTALRDTLEAMRDEPPEVVEKIVRDESLEAENQRLKADLKKLSQEASQPSISPAEVQALEEKRKEKLTELRSIKNILAVHDDIDTLITRLAPIRYQQDLARLLESDLYKRDLLSRVQQVQDWCDDMYSLCHDRTIQIAERV
ncbi:DUF3102 domain-containing protein [Aerococcus sanguinicola]